MPADSHSTTLEMCLCYIKDAGEVNHRGISIQITTNINVNAGRSNTFLGPLGVEE